MNRETPTTGPRYSVLILAGSRRGPSDPLAMAGGVSHKCFIDIAGEPMLRRVVREVVHCGRAKRAVISIDAEQIDAAKAMVETLNSPIPISFTPSQASLGSSTIAALNAAPDMLPMVVTTGDNALHTAEMVAFFCDALNDSDADAAFGLTKAEVLLAKYPDGQRAFHRFRDGGVSGCNLYALMTSKAEAAARAFDSGGQFAKKPWRFIFSFGLPTFILYKSRLATLAGFTRFLSRALGLKSAAVFMPFAEGPIDVDRIEDWKKAETIIRARQAELETATA